MAPKQRIVGMKMTLGAKLWDEPKGRFLQRIVET